MEFKKMIFVLVITTSIVFSCMLGTSYAYYALNEGTSLNVTTGTFDSSVAVVFNQSEYLNVNTGVPLASNEIDTYASKSIFTLQPDSSVLSGYDVAINIGLTNISIDDALKVDDFKYNLYCSDGTNNNLVGSGTGKDITGSEVSIGGISTSSGTFDVSKTYTCTLRAWLQDSGEDQNNLMNRKFSGMIKVTSMYRK